VKGLLKKLYTKLTGPLYRRLLRDLTVQIQDAHATTLDYQEKIAAKLLDELVCVRLEMDRAVEQVHQVKESLNAPLDAPKISAAPHTQSAHSNISKITQSISDEEIHKIVNEISSHMKIVELACDTQVPMSEILDWRSRYSGLTVNAVRKMRRVEAENEHLKQELARYKLEASVKTDAELLT
jgi:hypothetical protein